MRVIPLVVLYTVIYVAGSSIEENRPIHRSSRQKLADESSNCTRRRSNCSPARDRCDFSIEREVPSESGSMHQWRDSGSNAGEEYPSVEEVGRVARNRVRATGRERASSLGFAERRLLSREEIEDVAEVGRRKRALSLSVDPKSSFLVPQSNLEKTDDLRRDVEHNDNDFVDSDEEEGLARDSQNSPVWQAENSPIVQENALYSEEAENLDEAESTDSPDASLNLSSNDLASNSDTEEISRPELRRNGNRYLGNIQRQGFRTAPRIFRLQDYYRRIGPRYRRVFRLIPISDNRYPIGEAGEDKMARYGHEKLVLMPIRDRTAAMLSFKAHMHHNVKDIGRPFLKRVPEREFLVYAPNIPVKNDPDSLNLNYQEFSGDNYAVSPLDDYRIDSSDFQEVGEPLSPLHFQTGRRGSSVDLDTDSVNPTEFLPVELIPSRYDSNENEELPNPGRKFRLAYLDNYARSLAGLSANANGRPSDNLSNEELDDSLNESNEDSRVVSSKPNATSRSREVNETRGETSTDKKSLSELIEPLSSQFQKLLSTIKLVNENLASVGRKSGESKDGERIKRDAETKKVRGKKRLRKKKKKMKSLKGVSSLSDVFVDSSGKNGRRSPETAESSSDFTEVPIEATTGQKNSSSTENKLTTVKIKDSLASLIASVFGKSKKATTTPRNEEDNEEALPLDEYTTASVTEVSSTAVSMSSENTKSKEKTTTVERSEDSVFTTVTEKRTDLDYRETISDLGMVPSTDSWLPPNEFQSIGTPVFTESNEGSFLTMSNLDFGTQSVLSNTTVSTEMTTGPNASQGYAETPFIDIRINLKEDQLVPINGSLVHIHLSPKIVRSASGIRPRGAESGKQKLRLRSANSQLTFGSKRINEETKKTLDPVMDGDADFDPEESLREWRGPTGVLREFKPVAGGEEAASNLLDPPEARRRHVRRGRTLKSASFDDDESLEKIRRFVDRNLERIKRDRPVKPDENLASWNIDDETGYFLPIAQLRDLDLREVVGLEPVQAGVIVHPGRNAKGKRNAKRMALMENATTRSRDHTYDPDVVTAYVETLELLNATREPETVGHKKTTASGGPKMKTGTETVTFGKEIGGHPEIATSVIAEFLRTTQRQVTGEHLITVTESSPELTSILLETDVLPRLTTREEDRFEATERLHDEKYDDEYEENDEEGDEEEKKYEDDDYSTLDDVMAPVTPLTEVVFEVTLPKGLDSPQQISGKFTIQAETVLPDDEVLATTTKKYMSKEERKKWLEERLRKLLERKKQLELKLAELEEKERQWEKEKKRRREERKRKKTSTTTEATSEVGSSEYSSTFTESTVEESTTGSVLGESSTESTSETIGAATTSAVTTEETVTTAYSTESTVASSTAEETSTESTTETTSKATTSPTTIEETGATVYTTESTTVSSTTEESSTETIMQTTSIVTSASPTTEETVPSTSTIESTTTSPTTEISTSESTSIATSTAITTEESISSASTTETTTISPITEESSTITTTEITSTTTSSPSTIEETVPTTSTTESTIASTTIEESSTQSTTEATSTTTSSPSTIEETVPTTSTTESTIASTTIEETSTQSTTETTSTTTSSPSTIDETVTTTSTMESTIVSTTTEESSTQSTTETTSTTTSSPSTIEETVTTTSTTESTIASTTIEESSTQSTTETTSTTTSSPSTIEETVPTTSTMESTIVSSTTEESSTQSTTETTSTTSSPSTIEETVLTTSPIMFTTISSTTEESSTKSTFSTETTITPTAESTTPTTSGTESTTVSPTTTEGSTEGTIGIVSVATITSITTEEPILTTVMKESTSISTTGEESSTETISESTTTETTGPITIEEITTGSPAKLTTISSTTTAAEVEEWTTKSVATTHPSVSSTTESDIDEEIRRLEEELRRLEEEIEIKEREIQEREKQLERDKEEFRKEEESLLEQEIEEKERELDEREKDLEDRERQLQEEEEKEEEEEEEEEEKEKEHETTSEETTTLLTPPTIANVSFKPETESTPSPPIEVTMKTITTAESEDEEEGKRETEEPKEPEEPEEPKEPEEPEEPEAPEETEEPKEPEEQKEPEEESEEKEEDKGEEEEEEEKEEEEKVEEESSTEEGTTRKLEEGEEQTTVDTRNKTDTDYVFDEEEGVWKKKGASGAEDEKHRGGDEGVEVVTTRVCLNVLKNASHPAVAKQKGLRTKEVCLPLHREESKKKRLRRLSRKLFNVDSIEEGSRDSGYVGETLKMDAKRSNMENTSRIYGLNLKHHEWVGPESAKELKKFEGFTRVYQRWTRVPIKRVMIVTRPEKIVYTTPISDGVTRKQWLVDKHGKRIVQVQVDRLADDEWIEGTTEAGTRATTIEYAEEDENGEETSKGRRSIRCRGRGKVDRLDEFPREYEENCDVEGENGDGDKKDEEVDQQEDQDEEKGEELEEREEESSEDEEETENMDEEEVESQRGEEKEEYQDDTTPEEEMQEYEDKEGSEDASNDEAGSDEASSPDEQYGEEYDAEYTEDDKGEDHYEEYTGDEESLAGNIGEEKKKDKMANRRYAKRNILQTRPNEDASVWPTERVGRYHIGGSKFWDRYIPQKQELYTQEKQSRTVNVLRLEYDDEEETNKVKSVLPKPEELTIDEGFVTADPEEEEMASVPPDDEEAPLNERENEEVFNRVREGEEEDEDDRFEEVTEGKEADDKSDQDQRNKQKKKKKKSQRQTPGPEWPTERSTKYHVGGTTFWDVEIIGQKPPKVSEKKEEEEDEEVGGEALESTTCFHVILNNLTGSSRNQLRRYSREDKSVLGKGRYAKKLDEIGSEKYTVNFKPSLRTIKSVEFFNADEDYDGDFDDRELSEEETGSNVDLSRSALNSDDEDNDYGNFFYEVNDDGDQREAEPSSTTGRNEETVLRVPTDNVSTEKNIEPPKGLITTLKSINTTEGLPVIVANGIERTEEMPTTVDTSKGRKTIQEVALLLHIIAKSDNSLNKSRNSDYVEHSKPNEENYITESTPTTRASNKVPVFVQLDDSKYLELQNVNHLPNKIYVVYKCESPRVIAEYDDEEISQTGQIECSSARNEETSVPSGNTTVENVTTECSTTCRLQESSMATKPSTTTSGTTFTMTDVPLQTESVDESSDKTHKPCRMWSQERPKDDFSDRVLCSSDEGRAKGQMGVKKNNNVKRRANVAGKKDVRTENKLDRKSNLYDYRSVLERQEKSKSKMDSSDQFRKLEGFDRGDGRNFYHRTLLALKRSKVRKRSPKDLHLKIIKRKKRKEVSPSVSQTKIRKNVQAQPRNLLEKVKEVIENAVSNSNLKDSGSKKNDFEIRESTETSKIVPTLPAKSSLSRGHSSFRKMQKISKNGKGKPQAKIHGNSMKINDEMAEEPKPKLEHSDDFSLVKNSVHSNDKKSIVDYKKNQKKSIKPTGSKRLTTKSKTNHSKVSKIRTDPMKSNLKEKRKTASVHADALIPAVKKLIEDQNFGEVEKIIVYVDKNDKTSDSGPKIQKGLPENDSIRERKTSSKDNFGKSNSNSETRKYSRLTEQNGERRMHLPNVSHKKRANWLKRMERENSRNNLEKNKVAELSSLATIRREILRELRRNLISAEEARNRRSSKVKRMADNADDSVESKLDDLNDKVENLYDMLHGNYELWKMLKDEDFENPTRRRRDTLDYYNSDFENDNYDSEDHSDDDYDKNLQYFRPEDQPKFSLSNFERSSQQKKLADPVLGNEFGNKDDFKNETVPALDQLRNEKIRDVSRVGKSVLANEGDLRSLKSLINDIADLQKNVNTTLKILEGRLGSTESDKNNGTKKKANILENGSKSKKKQKKEVSEDQSDSWDSDTKKFVKIGPIGTDKRTRNDRSRSHGGVKNDKTKGKGGKNKENGRKSKSGKNKIRRSKGAKNPKRKYGGSTKKKLETKTSNEEHIDEIGNDIKRILTEESVPKNGFSTRSNYDIDELPILSNSGESDKKKLRIERSDDASKRGKRHFENEVLNNTKSKRSWKIVDIPLKVRDSRQNTIFRTVPVKESNKTAGISLDSLLLKKKMAAEPNFRKNLSTNSNDEYGRAISRKLCGVKPKTNHPQATGRKSENKSKAGKQKTVVKKITPTRKRRDKISNGKIKLQNQKTIKNSTKSTSKHRGNSQTKRTGNRKKDTVASGDCLNCICDVENVFEKLKKILGKSDEPTEEIKSFECEKFQNLGSDLLVTSRDEDIFLRPRHSFEKPRGEKYVRPEEVEDVLKRDIEVQNESVVSLPDVELTIPCNQDGEDVSWLPAFNEPVYTWTRTDGAPHSGLVKKNGDLEFREVEARDSGNYSCTVSYSDPDTDEHLENVYKTSVQILTLPKYTLYGESNYQVQNCDETDLEDLLTSFPKKLNDVLCKRDVCNAYVLSPRCSSNKIFVNVIIVPARLSKFLPIDSRTCGVFCLKATQDKLALVLSKNLSRVLRKTRSETVDANWCRSRERKFRGEEEEEGRTEKPSGNIREELACSSVVRQVPCPAGSYSEDGAVRCKTCPSGTHQPGRGARSCKTCSNPFSDNCYTMLWNSSAAIMVTLTTSAALISVTSLLIWMICCTRTKNTANSCARSREARSRRVDAEKEPLVDSRSEDELDPPELECKPRKKSRKIIVKRKGDEIHQVDPGARPHRKRHKNQTTRVDSYRSHTEPTDYSQRRSYVKKPPLPFPDFDR